MGEYHACARCGVADRFVVYDKHLDGFSHSPHKALTGCGYAALKREVAALREREESGVVAIEFALRFGALIRNRADLAEHFAAFRQSEAWPK